MTTTTHREHCCEQPPAHPAQDDYGALAYMLTFEEIDDAIDVLERIISAREEENHLIADYVNTANGGVSVNMPLHRAIDQLRAERAHRAIPEAVMDAAIAQLEGTTDDDTQDDDYDCDHT